MGMDSVTSGGLSHLFMTIFLYNFSVFMVIPAITDVTMLALCPGQDECSLAIYLTGFQHAITGVGTLVMMPLIGNLSDLYGRKALLTIPMSLTIIPLAILAYKRTESFFYAYYVLKTLTAMVCEGSVNCLALAYVADKVPENKRASVFGILSGVASCAFVCGNLSTRFISTSSTFQVATAMAMVATLYMRVFLPESMKEQTLSLHTKLIQQEQEEEELNEENKLFKGMPSLSDMISLIKISPTFSQAAVVAFLASLGDGGLHTGLMYYLKARFHFNKNQFADLMVIAGIAGTASQLLLMPLLIATIGEEKLLSVGLFFSFAHMFLYSVAWSSWVPYVAAMFSISIVFSQPCLRSIASKQVGPSEQGKAQGCISGIASLANVVSPLTFTPLTALFLSEAAPFSFPGFSIMCIGFVAMVAFIQSLLIRPAPSMSDYSTEGRHHRTLVTAILVPMVAMLTAAAVITFLVNNVQKRRKQNREDKDDEVGTELTDSCLEFSLKTIRGATDDFSTSKKLGQGGFGAVYKGTLRNGQHIAVKKLAVHSIRGEVEFKNEVQLMAKLHHKNLISLIGFCIEEKERLLIYELALNGSLDRILFDPIRREELNWEIRYNIIEGIARGVLYLHDESQQRIIHRDLKPSNILLDESMNAKISDFGTARLYVEDQSSASKIVGTYGYMAPEYVKHGKISVKIDVFSFGVLLLEIVCGKKNSASRDRDHIDHLLSKAWKYWTAGRLEELIDPVLLRGKGQIDEIARCIHIGLLCVQGNAACRPTMNLVIVMLEDCSQSLPLPLQPAYFMLISEDEPRRIDQDHPVSSEPNSGQQTNVSSYSSSGFSSVNEITITHYPEPR